MDEELSIINSETRKEKIKNFFIKNRKKIIIIMSLLVLLVIIFFSYKTYQSNYQEKLANKYNSAVISFKDGEKLKAETALKEIVFDKDTTYSPLALYFLIDNEMIKSKKEINGLFDIIIEKTNLDKEIKYLNIYKKGLFNSDFENEENLLKILDPIINSSSVWKSHALYLMGEYLYSKEKYDRAKDFFNQILDLEDSNPKIKLQTEKKLQSDFNQ